MKRYTIAALVFVLTAALLTGCMGRNDSQNATTTPTIMPTTEAPTTMPAVETTMPSTEPTMHTETTEPSVTETVGEDGVVGSDPTDDTGINSRSRKVPMGR